MSSTEQVEVIARGSIAFEAYRAGWLAARHAHLPETPESKTRLAEIMAKSYVAARFPSTDATTAQPSSQSVRASSLGDQASHE